MKKQTDGLKDYEWQTLPISLMHHFNSSHEWALIQLIWFNANLDGWVINLSKLNEDSCIKSRGTVLRVVARFVERKWLEKQPLGTSAKHHKYIFNKPAFIEWVKSSYDAEKVLNETSESLKQDFPKSQTGLVEVSNRTFQSLKQDCIANRDNLSENFPENSLANSITGKKSDVSGSQPPLRTTRFCRAKCCHAGAASCTPRCAG